MLPNPLVTPWSLKWDTLTDLIATRVEVYHVTTFWTSLPRLFLSKLDSVCYLLVLRWAPCPWVILLLATRTSAVATAAASCFIPLDLLGLDEGGAGRAVTVDPVSGIHLGFSVVILPDEFGLEVRLHLAYVEGTGCWAAPNRKACFITQGAFESHLHTVGAVVVTGFSLGASARSEKLPRVESVCANHTVSLRGLRSG